MRRSLKVVLLAGIAVLLCPAAAIASGPASSPLPGYPRFRGVMLVHNGSAVSGDREEAIAQALEKADAQRSPRSAPPSANASVSHPTPDCAPYLKGNEGEYPGADLCWWGGQVAGANTVHLIFWEGPSGHEIPKNYREAIENYFVRVAAASRNTLSNVYAVGGQYGDAFEPSGRLGYSVSFFNPEDVYIDKAPLSASGSLATQCEDPAAPAGEPCVTDKDLQTQITLARGVNGTSWGETLHDLYFVFTPPEVGSCFYDNEEAKGHNECAFESYCAYHSSFYSKPTSREEMAGPPEYADIPDTGGVEGCDSFEYPNEPEGVDAVLDSTSHEHNETITDPLLTYNIEPFELVSAGWLDLIGQEEADKCLPPENFAIYGGALGGEPGALYNQIIGGGDYWLQTEWSNTAFKGEGGCVQRMLPVAFTPPSEAKATVPTTFDGSFSGEAGDPAVYWVWSFGDGMQSGTPEAKTAHTYAQPGTYTVTLTAFDAYGNSNTFTTTVGVGAAPPPVAPPPAPEPITLTKTVNVLVPVEPTAYTASELASKLGLPANGTRLSGLRPITIGHAECPPACTVTVRLYALEHATVHGHRLVKRVFIGALTTKVAAKGSRKLALKLNATGRKLLRKSHRLSAQLLVSVTGREGGSWRMTRRVTLTR